MRGAALSPAPTAALMSYGAVRRAESSCGSTDVRIAALRDRKMAKVAVLVKVYPEGPDELERAKEGIESLKAAGYQVMRVEEEPIAFGLKALNVLFVIPEEEGSLAELEKRLLSISGVSSIEVSRASRL